MRWFKHFNDLLDKSELQFLLDKHGTNGTHAYIRLLEYAAKNFDVQDPGKYLESQRHLFSLLFPRCCKRTGKSICETLQNLGLAQFVFKGKEVLFKVPEMIELADEYTKKTLKDQRNEKK